MVFSEGKNCQTFIYFLQSHQLFLTPHLCSLSRFISSTVSNSLLLLKMDMIELTGIIRPCPHIWVTWKNSWFVTIGSSSTTAHQKKNNDIPNFHSTSTEILFIQPLNPIYFTLWTNGGQPVWTGNSAFWFSVWWRWSCMGALIVKNKNYINIYRSCAHF